METHTKYNATNTEVEKKTQQQHINKIINNNISGHFWHKRTLMHFDMKIVAHKFSTSPLQEYDGRNVYIQTTKRFSQHEHELSAFNDCKLQQQQQQQSPSTPLLLLPSPLPPHQNTVIRRKKN